MNYAEAFGEQPQPTPPQQNLNDQTNTEFSQIKPDEYTGHGGKSFMEKKDDALGWFYAYVNKGMIVFKLFYFFFFAAFGSFFPLISVYFKQLGMSAVQTGVLSGVRSIVECFGAPFWSHLAEKWKKGKQMLMGSLLCWTLFTIAFEFVTPKPEGCLVSLPREKYPNGSYSSIQLAIHKPGMKYSYNELKAASMIRVLSTKKNTVLGQSPLYVDVDNLVKYDKIPRGIGDSYDRKQSATYNPFVNPDNYAVNSLVMPLYSTVVYSQSTINQTFAILLLLITLGEIFACPAVCLADANVLLHLEKDPSSSYGRQRMFGSVGWGLAMLFVGLALDHSNSFPGHPCLEAGSRERNYKICFTLFTIFMTLAIMVASQFNFGYEGSQESMYFKVVKDKFSKTFLGRQTKNRSKLVNEEGYEDESGGQEKMTNEDILEKQLGVKFEKRQDNSTGDNLDPYEDGLQHTAQLKVTKWATVFQNFKSPRLAVFLFVAWFMGIGMGLTFSFLFWHMQEYSGSPTLFGIASVINHVSEIVAYYFSKHLIMKFGHVHILNMGLIANVVRFLYVSWITNPWWILPCEFLQGLTHAAVWAACCSYIAETFPSDLRVSTQGFLQATHHGLARGLGSIFGGLIIDSYGSNALFRSYGAASAVILILFLAIEMLLGKNAEASQNKEQDQTGYQPTESNPVAAGGAESATHPYYDQSGYYAGTNSSANYGADPQYSTTNYGGNYGNNYGGGYGGETQSETHGGGAPQQGYAQQPNYQQGGQVQW